MIAVTVMIKNGGYKKIQIPPKMLGDLALAIQKKGSEIVHLVNGAIIVVGILLTSKETGERVVIIGEKE